MIPALTARMDTGSEHEFRKIEASVIRSLVGTNTTSPAWVADDLARSTAIATSRARR